MDYRQDNGFSVGNVVQIIGGNGNSTNVSQENWGPMPTNQAVWATEEDYSMWSGESSVINNPSTPLYDGKISQSLSGTEPPYKRTRNSVSTDLISSNRAKAIGKMFYKTKLCCKFRAGTCPYVTNCNFAHSVEELRKPPPNWQEIVAAHDEERVVSSEPREEFQIPILGVTDEIQRSHKGRHCKKFYTEEGCPYGDSCTFMHDEQSRTRETVAISLGPGPGAGNGYVASGNGSTLIKPSNWKTRICNKWELTGYCPFGSKCHFAHGAAELNRFGGGPLESENRDSSNADGNKQGSAAASKNTVESAVAAGNNLPPSAPPPLSDSGCYHIGGAPQRPSNTIQRSGFRPAQKWKGPDKISKIYGDWIDDL
ncbi:hypothetical protein M569_11366 [Genlisea aurea]|uniref:C3H1-type domain-containing protein n=1 Tax=Genlisea aurea TaxID=192259 RepID=S8DKR4_9LAMI|nr:hypothetical protein M569_11366 [Genlisea aurea]